MVNLQLLIKTQSERLNQIELIRNNPKKYSIKPTQLELISCDDMEVRSPSPSVVISPPPSSSLSTTSLIWFPAFWNDRQLWNKYNFCIYNLHTILTHNFNGEGCVTCLITPTASSTFLGVFPFIVRILSCSRTPNLCACPGNQYGTNVSNMWIEYSC